MVRCDFFDVNVSEIIKITLAKPSRLAEVGVMCFIQNTAADFGGKYPWFGSGSCLEFDSHLLPRLFPSRVDV